MQFITDDIKTALPPCVATIGCFDGVHRGHRYLIRQVTQIGQEKGLHTTLITFPVHPRQVMQSDYQPQLLSCLPQKEALIQTLQVDYCLMMAFTRELSELSAYEFMKLLHERFNVCVLVIGYDHRFGHNRTETFKDYCRYGAELGIEVTQARALVEDGVSVSSSVIRNLLNNGEIAEANHYLSYRYFLDGTVIDGYKMGRKLGFPTANLQPSCPNKLIPAEGVYAVYVYIDEIRYMGMLNIGYRPTVHNGENRSIEVYIIDFSGDIYHKQIRIEFMERIRREQKFESINALISQLNQDKDTVIRILGNRT
ncbi:MAG: bifunctional riboflavin kinase/FAD synthetase [Bacteroides sp.]|nr:bifunctional riboflavin kinase/FAD synthetase [Bacteroides sp.]